LIPGSPIFSWRIDFVTRLIPAFVQNKFFLYMLGPMQCCCTLNDQFFREKSKLFYQRNQSIEAKITLSFTRVGDFFAMPA
jgi:hypothetical protein